MGQGEEGRGVQEGTGSSRGVAGRGGGVHPMHNHELVEMWGHTHRKYLRDTVLFRSCACCSARDAVMHC
eukprot:2589761-Alexandrium_andersonii.AAC.1